VIGGERTSDDVAQDALARMAPLLCDFVVELVKGFHRLVRLVQQPLNLLLLRRSLLSIVLVLAGLPLLQLLNLPVVAFGHYAVSSDPDLDGFDEVVERLGAENEDVATRSAGVCAGVADVSGKRTWRAVMSKTFLLSPPSAR